METKTVNPYLTNSFLKPCFTGRFQSVLSSFVWVALLMMAAVPFAGAQDEEERVFWESIRCGEEKEVRLYLEEYPRGAYVDEAIECLRATILGTEENPPLQDPQGKIARLLEECGGHLQANRLTSGAGGNALECYRSVLDQDPGNAQALAGLQRIEETYIRWARSAISQGDVENAQQNLDKLNILNPEHQALAELADGLDKLRQGARMAKEEEQVRRDQDGKGQAQRSSTTKDANEDKTAAASQPGQLESYQTQMKLVQKSSGSCHNSIQWGPSYGCVATIEIYIDDSRIAQVEKLLDSPIDEVVWQDALRGGSHNIRVRSHYHGEQGNEFRGDILAENAGEIMVSIRHAGQLENGPYHTNFRPMIQVFYAGNEVPDSR